VVRLFSAQNTSLEIRKYLSQTNIIEDLSKS